jgi:hypothetical protein
MNSIPTFPAREALTAVVDALARPPSRMAATITARRA